MRIDLSPLFVALLISLMGAQGYAQEAGTAEESAEAGATEPDSGADIGVPLADVATRSASEDVSPKEMRSKANNAGGEMQSWQQGLAQRLGEARQEQNIVLMNCINPLLTRVKGFLSIVNQSIISLVTLVASGNLSDAAHEYDKVMMAYEKARDAYGQSESCVSGEEIFEGEGTELEVEVVSEDAEEGVFLDTDEADQEATADGGADVGSEEWMEDINADVARMPPASYYF
jgi:hypothetical protein